MVIPFSIVFKTVIICLYLTLGNVFKTCFVFPIHIGTKRNKSVGENPDIDFPVL